MNRRDFIKTTALSGGVLTTPNLLGNIDRNTRAAGKRIKIGQIGVTHEHAGGRMESLKKIPEIYEIVGIVDDRQSTAARFAGDNLKPFEGIKWMTEEELFSVPDLQAVMVETANEDLVPTALRCMKRNLAIAMDKPGGEDLELFGKLMDGCKERGLPFQIAYMFRGNPAIQFCQKAIREGWIGDIFEIQAGMSHDYGGSERYHKYLSSYKGGIMFNLGCHLTDIIVSMMGSPKKVTSFLGATTKATSGVSNNGLAVLEYDHALAWINACDMEIGGIKNRRLKICGSKGVMELSPIERFDGKPLLLNLTLKEAAGNYEKGTHTIDFGVQTDRYENQLMEFAGMVRKEVTSNYSYEHDYLAQKVHLAASGYIKW
jgi:predicted dehydrogenase